MRLLTILILALLAPHGLRADCAPGQNLIQTLPAEQHAVLQSAADAAPFAHGNLWHATRGAQHITLVGTFHLADPRHQATLTALAPDLATATALLVEAGPVEQAALKADFAAHPDRLLHPGPTLPETLSPQDWARLSTALAARNIPPFFAARLQPWFVATLLAVPACQTAPGDGLDQLLITAATSQHLPVVALEPFDTLFRIFGTISDTDQTDMLLETLATTGALEADTARTLSDSYFAGESRLFWEFSRYQLLQLPGADPVEIDHQFALVQDKVITDRNHAWLPVIEAQAAHGPLIVAFGALHLAGDTGVLALLQQDGWIITPW